MKFYSNASICWFLKNRKLKSQITTASKNAGRSKTNHNSSTTPWIPLHFLASITKRSKLHVETFESILVFCWLVTSLQLEVRLKETWDPHSKGTTFQNLQFLDCITQGWSFMLMTFSINVSIRCLCKNRLIKQDMTNRPKCSESS